MKIAFSTLGCPDWDLQQIASFAGEHAYDGVELRTCEDGNHFSPDASADEARATGQLFKDKGTSVFSLTSYARFAFPDLERRQTNAELLNRVIDVGEAMGASYIRIFGGMPEKGASLQDLMQPMADSLRPCLERARGAGITVAIETHDAWCKGSNIKALQKALGSDDLASIWDICNAWSPERTDVESTYNDLKGTICYCQLKDMKTGEDGKLHYVPSGDGETPLRAAVALLRADGFDGYLCLEHEKKWHPELDEPEVAFAHYAKFGRQLAGE